MIRVLRKLAAYTAVFLAGCAYAGFAIGARPLFEAIL
jgi:hypothetical protein